MIASLFQHRKFIWRNAFHDFRHRYAGSGMGVLWNVAHPLAMIGIYSLVFGGIMGGQVGGSRPRLWYVLYLCAGLVPWMAFADCVTRGCRAFLTNANFLKKLPVPEPVFIAQAMVGASINLAISFALLLIFALAVGQKPTVHWLAIPLALAALQLLGFAVGLVVGTLNVFFRDLQEWVGIVLAMAMWTVPIVYVIDILPPVYRRLLPYHPIWPALSAVRDLFLNATWPSATTWAAMVLWPAAIGALGAVVLRLLVDEIRDVI